MEWFYGVVQCSPIYQILRLKTDPWVSSWMYQDSPFHFLQERLVNPWSGLALVFIVLYLWIRRSFATH